MTSRRKFLAKLGMAAAALGLSPLLPKVTEIEEASEVAIVSRPVPGINSVITFIEDTSIPPDRMYIFNSTELTKIIHKTIKPRIKEMMEQESVIWKLVKEGKYDNR